MRKSKVEQVDEYAETQVLLGARSPASDGDPDLLSLYAEYERELTHESAPQPARKRR
jgi:hypothetical protein